MFADTSILVELFRRPGGDAFLKDILCELGEDIVLGSPIQISELADHARKHGASPEEAAQKAAEILEFVPLDPEIAAAASALKAEARTRPNSKEFSLIDGVILASARSKHQRLLTADNGFRGFEDVVILRPARAGRG